MGGRTGPRPGGRTRFVAGPQSRYRANRRRAERNVGVDSAYAPATDGPGPTVWAPFRCGRHAPVGSATCESEPPWWDPCHRRDRHARHRRRMGGLHLDLGLLQVKPTTLVGDVDQEVLAPIVNGQVEVSAVGQPKVGGGGAGATSTQGACGARCWSGPSSCKGAARRPVGLTSRSARHFAAASRTPCGATAPIDGFGRGRRPNWAGG